MNDVSFTPISSVAEEPAVNSSANASADAEPLKKSAQNLLLHIPGEASELYLTAADASEIPTGGAISFHHTFGFDNFNPRSLAGGLAPRCGDDIDSDVSDLDVRPRQRSVIYFSRICRRTRSV